MRVKIYWMPRENLTVRRKNAYYGRDIVKWYTYVLCIYKMRKFVSKEESTSFLVYQRNISLGSEKKFSHQE